MSDLVAKARAALDGVTPGPWCVADETVVWTQINEPIETTYDIGYPLAETKRQKSFWTMANWPEGEPEANARFIAAARSLVPEMADRIEALEAENARLRYGLECVYQYGSDTLVGPSHGVPDDRTWQRDGVLIMTARARATLEGASEQDIVSIRAPFASPPTPETSHD